MPDYKNSKIYKLVGSGLTYYGSTTQQLCERKAGHKRQSNDCKSKILFEEGDVDIILVESFPCNNKEELLQRERYYIENNECVNKSIPIKTIIEKKQRKKEYQEIYKEHKKEYDKEYREKNKDKLLGKIICECGGCYKLKHKETHFKTNKHLTYIKDI